LLYFTLHALASVAICLVDFVPNWGVWPLCSFASRKFAYCKRQPQAAAVSHEAGFSRVAERHQQCVACDMYCDQRTGRKSWRLLYHRASNRLH
jgi:hypothetical protein